MEIRAVAGELKMDPSSAKTAGDAYVPCSALLVRFCR